MSSTKHTHQPRNPFRTPPVDENKLPSFCSNPIVQVCYFVAVGGLLIAVSYMVFANLPVNTKGPPATTATDLKQQQKVSVRKVGGGVRGQSRFAPNSNNGSSNNIFASIISTTETIKSTDYDTEEDEEDIDTVVHDVIDEEELVELQRANPAGANLKLLGETKELVKQEIQQEEHSDHAFGIDDDYTSSATSSDLKKDTGITKDEEDSSSKDDEKVHVVPIRKSDISATSADDTRTKVLTKEDIDEEKIRDDDDVEENEIPVEHIRKHPIAITATDE